MTEPIPPAATTQLTTLAELAVWVQEPEIPEDKVLFAEYVLAGVAVVIRHYGSQWWVHDPTPEVPPLGHVIIPPRAKLIADLKAKNFYEHPTGAVSETVGPISERYLDQVVQQIELTDSEKALLVSLAPDDDPTTDEVVISGLWALSTTRGPLETHSQRGGGVITVPYWRPGSDGVPLYRSGAFGSPDEWDTL